MKYSSLWRKCRLIWQSDLFRNPFFFIKHHRNILATNTTPNKFIPRLFFLFILLVFCYNFYSQFVLYSPQNRQSQLAGPHLTPALKTDQEESTITNRHDIVNQPNLKPAPIKKILLYNELFGVNRLFVGTGKWIFTKNHCQFSRCQLFVNPYLRKKRPLNSYDAVVFFIDVFTEAAKMIKDLSKGKERIERRSSQRYVALRYEAPVDPPESYSIKKDLLVNFFNWSMSYRQDADIQLPYGSIRPLPQLSEEHGGRRNRIKINNKSKNGSSAVVAWKASHCPTASRREDRPNE